MALTPAQKKLMTKLLDLEGAVRGERDPFAYGIDTPSPSMNFTFDNTWMLPDGYTLLMGGAPKGGKSILINSIEGRLHTSDEDAVTMKYNTELREEVQCTPQQKKLWGIDNDRRIVYQVREPAAIFDRIETEVPKLIQGGVKLRLCIIDSLNDILGRRTMNADSVDVQQMGDRAQTLQDGLSRVKEVLRRNNVSLIMTSQVRSEMDTNQQKYGTGPRVDGTKVKFAVSWAVKHQAEYFLFVERFKNKGSDKSLTGEGFVDETVVGLDGEGDERAHKIRVTMVDNSLGRPGRVGLFTLDHDLGIINTHEEVFGLGLGFNVIEQPTLGRFNFADRSWHGKEKLLEAINGEPELYSAILKGCKAKDLARRG
jgi:RecA/RadA recombinase